MAEFTINQISTEHRAQVQVMQTNLTKHLNGLPNLRLNTSDILFLSYLLTLVKIGYGQPRVITMYSSDPTFEQVSKEYPVLYTQLKISLGFENSEVNFRSLVSQFLNFER
jgi:hypothetical protein